MCRGQDSNLRHIDPQALMIEIAACTHFTVSAYLTETAKWSDLVKQQSAFILSLLLYRLSYLCMPITTTHLSLDLLTIQKSFFDGFVGAAESNRKQCFSRTLFCKIAVSVRRPIRFYELPSRTPRSPHLHGSSVLFTPSTQTSERRCRNQRLVLETGFEPVWCLHRQILSLLPLPI